MPLAAPVTSTVSPFTDRLSCYPFAPSADAVANLVAEGTGPDQVHLVGNVMVDTLLANAGRAATRGTLAALGLEPGRYGLVTLHRPANVDDPVVLAAMLPALAEISRECPLVLPAHPRAASRMQAAGLPASVTIIPPAGYLDFVALEASARLVLTDSGGVQEEAPALGKPVLVMRDVTERPEALAAGTVKLVGTHREAIRRAVLELVEDDTASKAWARRVNPYGDGEASARIVAALMGRPVTPFASAALPGYRHPAMAQRSAA